MQLYGKRLVLSVYVRVVTHSVMVNKEYMFTLVFRFSAKVHSPTDRFILLSQLLSSARFWLRDLEIDPRNYVTQLFMSFILEGGISLQNKKIS